MINSGSRAILFWICIVILGCLPGCLNRNPDAVNPGEFNLKVASYARLPYDTPLDAVKWTEGFWHERMQRLRDIYIPGVVDGSFLDLDNGSSLRNFYRALGREEGGALGFKWSDGDCFFLMDALSRMYAYQPDEYLKGKLDYWIDIFANVQKEDGLVDTWTTIGDLVEDSPWGRWNRGHEPGKLVGFHTYSLRHMCDAAVSHYRATGDTAYISIAKRFYKYYVETHRRLGHHVTYGGSFLYTETGDEFYLEALRQDYRPGQRSPFGPPFREASEVYGHNTVTFHELNTAATAYHYLGDSTLLNSLHRLVGNLLASKTYITGAVAPVWHGERPEMTVNGKTYPVGRLNEAVGHAFDLPGEEAYCESCGQCLYMEVYYHMFRLTGDAFYMDAAERSMYNTVPGCVDLERPNFFYCNPQEQLPGSARCETNPAGSGQDCQYTWKRQYTKSCACCIPKVLRALAMSAEMAYNLNDEGLWVNLYGSNSFSSGLPWGGSVQCRQTTSYPWEGKVSLELEKVKSTRAFSLFLRIPGWVNQTVAISVNGKAVETTSEGGTYFALDRKWKTGDIVELEMLMPVRYMAADPRVSENIGKVALMRGPVVYCLENEDIPAGMNIDSMLISGNAGLEPVYTDELGGLTKLSGSLIFNSLGNDLPQAKLDINPDHGLYQETSIGAAKSDVSGRDQIIDGGIRAEVDLIPFYARLNREGRYFKVWIPVVI